MTIETALFLLVFTKSGCVVVAVVVLRQTMMMMMMMMMMTMMMMMMMMMEKDKSQDSILRLVPDFDAKAAIHGIHVKGSRQSLPN